MLERSFRKLKLKLNWVYRSLWRYASNFHDTEPLADIAISHPLAIYVYEWSGHQMYKLFENEWENVLTLCSVFHQTPPFALAAIMFLKEFLKLAVESIVIFPTLHYLLTNFRKFGSPLTRFWKYINNFESPLYATTIFLFFRWTVRYVSLYRVSVQTISPIDGSRHNTSQMDAVEEMSWIT